MFTVALSAAISAAVAGHIHRVRSPLACAAVCYPWSSFVLPVCTAGQAYFTPRGDASKHEPRKNPHRVHGRTAASHASYPSLAGEPAPHARRAPFNRAPPHPVPRTPRGPYGPAPPHPCSRTHPSHACFSLKDPARYDTMGTGRRGKGVLPRCTPKRGGVEFLQMQGGFFA